MKINILGFLVVFTACVFSHAQQGQVSINQDKNISKLLEIKKDMNKNDSDRYKIQIYSGNRKEAEAAQNDFNKEFEDWPTIMQYETPNFKIWAGSFRTRLEADRALKKIKRQFPSAFIFKPKKSS
ncbi:SPOR domain-containing protein [Gaetbulibacter saemankumensis]|uniref:SPOR domain-containing protein n=1 Tax=Gaetbulibacter saemankumensis TaxID=311208 RepID=UPI000427A0A2|nr:SPOR domain-containing protein [Gaetbulibacter saemankumensis]